MNSNDNPEDARTLFVGNINPKVNEELLYELFLQAGPLERVRIPNDREGKPASYGFITFKHAASVLYALNIFEDTYLCKTRLNLRTRNNQQPYQANNMMFNNQMNNTMFNNQMNNTMFNNQMNMNFNQQKRSPVHSRLGNQHNRTPSGRNEQYRNESLQGRWNNQSHKRDWDMRPNENHRQNFKRHRR